jgi:hypothetical protein
MTKTTCVCHHHKPAAATHNLLCKHHNQKLDTLTHYITEAHKLLKYFYEPGTAQDDGKQIHGKRIDPPAPVRLDILSILDRRTTYKHPGDPVPVARIIEDWCGIIREDRNITTPTTPNLSDDLQLINTHLEWITQQEWVKDFLAELLIVRNALANAIGDNSPKPVGNCPITTDTQTCDGKLFQNPNNGLSVSCNTCGETWGELELKRLGLIIGANN